MGAGWHGCIDLLVSASPPCVSLCPSSAFLASSLAAASCIIRSSSLCCCSRIWAIWNGSCVT